MRVLLIQLSDVHMHESSNAVLGREERIVAAAAGVAEDVALCVLLLSGDIAQSGSENEFSIALQFVSAVKSALVARLRGVPVECVAIPGNHDCDLRGDQKARELIIQGVSASNDATCDASVIDLCTDVQRSFFEFRDSLASSALSAKSRLYYDYRFVVGSESIEVRCLNTSWLSQIHEKEGTLFYPVGEIPERSADAAVSITVLHHPFNWFHNENKRLLQRRLEQVSDVILTGHEHAHTRRTQVTSTGEVNEYIEGVALQVPWEPSDSGFNVVLLDTTAQEQKFARFEWEAGTEIYERRGAVEWESFQVNRLRARKDFALRPDFLAHLDDPGAGFEKSGKGRLKLADIFVFPELRHVSRRISDAPSVVRGEEVFEDGFASRHLLISGPEQSGKTCLAKAIFSRLFAKGFVPLFLDGESFSPQTGTRLSDALERRFAAQYGDESLEKYRQLDPSRRIIIIDCFHKLRIRRQGIAQLLTSLEQFAGRVILVTNDLAQAFGDIVHAQSVIEERVSYAHFRILPFGYLKRSELTSKWFMLDKSIDEEQLARSIKEAERCMEVVLGRNYVPAFPVFILAMLQGVDSAQQVDVSASTYGYFYELLVRNALAAGANKTEFGIAVAYLTFVAFELFKRGKKEVTEGELREITREYSAKYDVEVDFSDMARELVRRHVLFHVSDTFEFQYHYIYYYFVAKYLSDHITEEPIRDLIRTHSRQLDSEESANILLFLAHISNDPLIVDEMLINARSHFPDVAPARLEDDLAFLAEMLPGMPSFSYVEGDVDKNRMEQAKYRDALARANNLASTEVQSGEIVSEAYRLAQEHLSRLLAALKTLQILGQILKNHPGNIEAARKEEIARECYQLGFRILGSVNRLLEEGRAELVDHVLTALREDKLEEDHVKMVTRANAVVVGLAVSAAYGTIKRISFAVGHPKLGPTYQRVAAAVPTMSTKLVNMSIRLDQVAGFPRGEIVGLNDELESLTIARAVLQWLVLTHINLFPVNFQERQRVCSALGIKYRALEGVNPKQKLLGPGTA